MREYCTCKPRAIHPTDIDPPDGLKRDKNCPIHGIDPDDARDTQQDRAFAEYAKAREAYKT